MTDYVDISGGADDIFKEVTPVDNVRDCCKYNYQLLDNFCASRTAVSMLLFPIIC